MRTAKFSSIPTRRAKRPDGRLLRDMRKRQGGGRGGGRSAGVVAVLILAAIVAAGWSFFR